MILGIAVGVLSAVLAVSPRCASAGPEQPPAPNHPMLFGYYYADGRHGDDAAEVWKYTNLYIALPAGHWQGEPDPSVPVGLFKQAIRRAADNGKRIWLCVNCDRGVWEGEWKLSESAWWDLVLGAAAPAWGQVVLTEIAHEEDLSKAQMDAKARAFGATMRAKGLAARPIGAVYDRKRALSLDSFAAPNLDWVALEAYVDPPGSGSAAGDVAALSAYLDEVKRRVPADKELMLIMMAYDRNGAWQDRASLAELQDPPYLKAYDDPRVIGIGMFSYNRPGGTKFYPELRARHEAIGARILAGPTFPPPGDIPPPGGDIPPPEPDPEPGPDKTVHGDQDTGVVDGGNTEVKGRRTGKGGKARNKRKGQGAAAKNRKGKGDKVAKKHRVDSKGGNGDSHTPAPERVVPPVKPIEESGSGRPKRSAHAGGRLDIGRVACPAEPLPLEVSTVYRPEFQLQSQLLRLPEHLRPAFDREAALLAARQPPVDCLSPGEHLAHVADQLFPVLARELGKPELASPGLAFTWDGLFWIKRLREASERRLLAALQ